MPKIAWIACGVAFLMSGLAILSAFTDQILFLRLALIPLMAGVGILRRRVWSAYGFAFFQFAPILGLPLAVSRSGGRLAGQSEIIAAIAQTVVLSALFFFAGRSLAAAGSPRGWAVPWIAASGLITVPLVFVQPFVNPTRAMEDTILAGDRILVQRIPRPRPVRGDIIVLAYPVDRHQTFVERLIGFPGDHIRIADKVVYRNGAALTEPYAVHKTPYVDSYRDNFPSEPNVRLVDGGMDMLKQNVVNGEVVVPAGKYFVLGDNRDSSLDSRYWGFVDFADVIGRPFLIYYSEDQPRRIRWNRLFNRLQSP